MRRLAILSLIFLASLSLAVARGWKWDSLGHGHQEAGWTWDEASYGWTWDETVDSGDAPAAS